MLRRPRTALRAPLLLLALPAAAQSDYDPARAITSADLLRVRQVVSVDVADDGGSAVWAVREIQDGEDPSYRTHLEWVDLDDPDARPRRLTHGDRGASQPALSPDGRTLAFVRSADEGQGSGAQIWLLDLDRPGEARQLTREDQSVYSPRWRPDGGALLVSYSLDEDELDEPLDYDLERPGRAASELDDEIAAKPDGSREEIRAWLAANAEDRDPSLITRLAFQGEQGLRGASSWSQLGVVDLEGELLAISEGRGGFGSARWSPDGQWVAYTGRPPGEIHPDRVDHSALYRMRADGGRTELLLADPDWTVSGPVWSERGDALYVSVRETDEPTFRQRRLARLEFAAEELELLSAELDVSVSGLRPEGDGDLLFTPNWQGATPLWRWRAEEGRVEAVLEGALAVGAYDAGGGRVLCAVSNAANPSEVYLLERDGTHRRVSDCNASWIAERDLSLPETRWIEREDGTRVQYWVMEPTGRAPGRRYPTVLEMHGGPQVMWGPGSASMWHEFQLLCAWGYGVVYANPRGSSGYGYDHQKGNYRDWGVGPGGDVLAALDDALATEDWIDAERLFLTGGSYAGYLTAWIVGHDRRFRAAVAQRGVYDLATFFGEGNAFRLVEYAFGGHPWEPEVRALLDEQSPVTHVANITTPLLILHGSQDLRTGVSQSEMLYRALKVLERPVEYVRYPSTGHELSRSGEPKRRMDRLNRIVEFFERWADNDRRAPGSALPMGSAGPAAARTESGPASTRREAQGSSER